MEKNYERCIECGICTRLCVFLDKYNINSKDYASRPDLAFNCFLCGDCLRACPVNIDGRQISLDLRKELLDQGHNLNKEGFRILLMEKKNYIFKNYKDDNSKIAFFPGCNFPAYYPNTNKEISKRLKEELGISTIYDCCGKPIADLSMEEEKNQIRKRIEGKMEELGVEELITACPNCYYHFKENLSLEISMVYENKEVMEVLIDKDRKEISGQLFLPCPDKNTKEIYKALNQYVDLDQLEIIKSIQCCGAGGCAFVKEKELTAGLHQDFAFYEETVYSYCATCSGIIRKSREEIQHILCWLMGTDEEVSQGIKSLINRGGFVLSNRRSK